MHFSVPDTEELIDEAGNTFVGYNVQINGLFHCTVRYKQLHNLHEQLSKELSTSLPSFPPKKFFPLTAGQQEDRRLALDKYIQTIGQSTVINSSDLLCGFLFNAQLETSGNLLDSQYFDVFLLDGTKITFNISSAENTEQILKKVFKHINLNEEHYPYFSLFLTIQENGNFTVVRKLYNFESPIITQRNINRMDTRLIIAKWYWDIDVDYELMEDPVALNLLYIQTCAEVERGWIIAPQEVEQQLKVVKAQQDKEEYIQIARSLKFYGYIQFSQCTCDYPQPGTKVIIAIGRNELNMRICSSTEQSREISFRVTRIRCWRITTLTQEMDGYEESAKSKFELSLEYLMAKESLRWIVISSEQAILMSVCLQAMIDEFIFKTNGCVRPHEPSSKSWTYITRNGHSQIISGSPSIESVRKTTKSNELPTCIKVEPTIIKDITQKYFTMKNKKVEPAKSIVKQEKKYDKNGEILENNAFCMIGDDDL